MAEKRGYSATRMPSPERVWRRGQCSMLIKYASRGPIPTIAQPNTIFLDTRYKQSSNMPSLFRKLKGTDKKPQVAYSPRLPQPTRRDVPRDGARNPSPIRGARFPVRPRTPITDYSPKKEEEVPKSQAAIFDPSLRGGYYDYVHVPVPVPVLGGGDLEARISRLLIPYAVDDRTPLAEDGSNSRTPEQGLESHEILAATYALVKKWELAYNYAQKAIDGHYDLTGRDSDATMNAIGLMALICKRAGNDDAEYWFEMLPMEKTFATLLGPARREQPEPVRKNYDGMVGGNPDWVDTDEPSSFLAK